MKDPADLREHLALYLNLTPCEAAEEERHCLGFFLTLFEAQDAVPPKETEDRADAA